MVRLLPDRTFAGLIVTHLNSLFCFLYHNSSELHLRIHDRRFRLTMPSASAEIDV